MRLFDVFFYLENHHRKINRTHPHKDDQQQDAAYNGYRTAEGYIQASEDYPCDHQPEDYHCSDPPANCINCFFFHFSLLFLSIKNILNIEIINECSLNPRKHSFNKRSLMNIYKYITP